MAPFVPRPNPLIVELVSVPDRPVVSPESSTFNVSWFMPFTVSNAWIPARLPGVVTALPAVLPTLIVFAPLAALVVVTSVGPLIAWTSTVSALSVVI